MEHKARQAIHIEKQLGWAGVLGGRVSGDLQGGSNSGSQVDGVSGVTPACWLCGGMV